MGNSLTPAWAAGLWVNCPGSAQLQTLYPEPPGARSEKREEGIAFHHVVAQLINTFKDSHTMTSGEVVGTTTPNGVVVDDEMYGAANVFMMDVLKYCTQSKTPVSEVHIEEPVDLSFIRPGEVGFVDAHIHDVKNWEIVVWEGKFGHRFVDPFENWQMVLYVEGIVSQLKLSVADQERITVRFRVVQPRHYHGDGPVNEWVVKLTDLRAHVNHIKNRADEAHQNNARCIPGAHCADCSARAACSSLQESGFTVMDTVKEMGFGVPMTGAALAAEMALLEHAIDIAKNRLDGLQQQADHQIEQGASVPGYGRTTTSPALAWTSPAEEVEALGQLFGVDLVKSREPQLYTPTQAIREKGIDETVITEYAKRPPGKTKLTRIKGESVRKIFQSSKPWSNAT